MGEVDMVQQLTDRESKQRKARLYIGRLVADEIGVGVNDPDFTASRNHLRFLRAKWAEIETNPGLAEQLAGLSDLYTEAYPDKPRVQINLVLVRTCIDNAIGEPTS